MKHARPTVLYAAAVRDAVGINASPGAVLVQQGRVVAAGEPGILPEGLVEQAEVIERPKHLLLPAMINAHTHLGLTSIGPQPFDPTGGFVGWVKTVRHHQRESDASRYGAGLASVKLGKEHLEQSGIQAVGDIAHHPGFALLRGSQLMGVTFVELFGLGAPHAPQDLETTVAKAEGLQPHAPYSAGPAVYEAAARSGLPVSTHLAETVDECVFVAECDGPQLSYLREIGKWDQSFSEHYGQGLTPVQWMRPYLETVADVGGWLVAHCNYVGDDDITILADTNTSVAYCPLASEYFGHKDHRYRDMLAAGINVCLGTDSIVGTDPDDPQPLGLLSAMRRLYQRDQTDPDTLLAMATNHGAKALRLGDNLATLQPGAPARFACISIDPESNADPFVQVLTGQNVIEAISFDLPA
ncbi:MAG: amidohydrolase family protein [Planctomycetota bacterium]